MIMTDKTCTVTNKSAGIVIYKVPELNVRREFRPRETKKEVPVRELECLMSQSGGRVLLYHYLMVHEEDVLKRLVNREIAPEYWLTEVQIPRWINNCTLDEFKDALDFAPEGTKDLIKMYSVSVPLNDYSKRQALKDQLNFDVTAVIANSGTEDKIEANRGDKPAVRRASTAPISKVVTKPE